MKKLGAAANRALEIEAAEALERGENQSADREAELAPLLSDSPARGRFECEMPLTAGRPQRFSTASRSSVEGETTCAVARRRT